MPTGVQEEVVKEKGSQNGHRIIGTWYRQEANGKNRNVQENREKVGKGQLSRWERAGMIGNSHPNVFHHCMSDWMFKKKEHVQPLSKVRSTVGGRCARQWGMKRQRG